MLHGFDISAYQSTSAPAADFVIVKATEGSSYTNARYAAQLASARGRAKVVGAYHFARPEASSAVVQADHFLAVAKPGPRDLLCLDLEASGLSQAKTNAWAVAFAARLKERAPGNKRVIYMGSSYASNGTGKNLADHYEIWWYPQYPSARSTSTWPSSFSPWLPGGLTCGWARPHIWQFSSVFRGAYDANISTLTIEQLAGSGQPTPTEVDMLSGKITAGKGPKDGIELDDKGSFKKIKIGWDNTRVNPALGNTRQPPASVRLAMHVPGRKGTSTTVTVGASLTDTKGWADSVTTALPAGCDRIDIERNDDGTTLTFSVF